MKRLVIAVAVLLLIGAGSIYIPKLIHETVDTKQPNTHYVVSLGDSVAQGAGLSNSHDRSQDPCAATAAAFPFLLGHLVHEPVEQFACSGATVGATGSTSLLGQQYRLAQPFLAHNDVVVYAGANDVQWLKTLTACAQSACDTTQTSADIANKLGPLQKDLFTLLQQIQRAHPRHLIVNTYYSILAPGDTCYAKLGITPDKVSFINVEQAALNNTISVAATQAGASIVPIDFTGHTLCSPEPWIQGITDPAPLHPNMTGQQDIAKQDAAALSPSAISN